MRTAISTPFRPRRPRALRRCDLAAALLLATGSACPTQSALPPDELARVNGEPLTRSDLVQRWQEGPDAVRLRAMEAGGRHYLLDLTIDDMLLLQEARHRSLSPAFADLEPVHRRWMQRFLDAELAPAAAELAVPDEEVRAEYERSREALDVPERVRLEAGHFTTRERAAAALADAREAFLDEDPAALGRYLRRVGDPRQTGGPFISGLFDAADAEEAFGHDLAIAAFSEPWARRVYDQPVPFAGGWALVAFVARAEPRASSYEDAAPQIRARLAAARRDEALDRLAESFRGEHRVAVHEEAFDLVNWEVGVPGEGPVDPHATGPTAAPECPALDAGAAATRGRGPGPDATPAAAADARP